MNGLSGEQLTYLAATFSVAVSNGLSVDEINVLGNFLSTVGSNLSLIAAQRDAREDSGYLP